MCVCGGGACKYKYAYNDITENTENRVKSYSYSHYPTKTSLTVWYILFSFFLLLRRFVLQIWKHNFLSYFTDLTLGIYLLNIKFLLTLMRNSECLFDKWLPFRNTSENLNIIIAQPKRRGKNFNTDNISYRRIRPKSTEEETEMTRTRGKDILIFM